MFCATNIKLQNDGGWGISGDNGSTINASNCTINGNTGYDVSLGFGSRSTLNNNDIGSLSCDVTVLSRGTQVCP